MLLSIIIVEYRSIEDVTKCVKALAGRLTIPYEIIISSNSQYSKAETKEIIALTDKARWVFNERNGGFAYAMNRGLEVAKGDYLVIMNSDCILQTDLSQMIEFLAAHPKVGAVAPQMRDAAGEIQDTARPYITLWRLVKRFISRKVKRTVSVLETDMDYSRIQTVDWVIGAFIMVTRHTYELTHGLDEEYFMYAEDADWCTRIRKQGLEIVYFPKVWIEYKGTRMARKSWKYSKIFLRSHLHYWRKFGFFFGYPDRKKIIW